jgi:isopropylmalate/homocitrate/citramalate synthase
MKPWISENYWASPYNYDEEFRKNMKLPEKVIIHDATLRDGEQTPGVVFTVEEKVEIAKMLDEIGVERIEAGMPAVSEQDVQAIKQIVALGLKSKIFSFARATTGDIDLAVECGVDGVVIEIPTGKPKLQYQFPKWSEDDVIQRSVETVKYAKEKGLEVVYFGYDTTRADFDFLVRLYSAVIEQGKPDSIGIVDTMGCILPGAVKEMIQKLKSLFDIKVEIHTHNDFGMATAISFAAVEAGAEVIHTSINGLGERTGNTALEPTIVGLKVLYGLDVDYKFDKIRTLSKRVEEISNFVVPVNKPMTGDNIFVRESGIGIDLVLNQPRAMFATSPSFIGHQGGVVLGKKSGAKSIEVKLEQLNIEVDPEAIPEILAQVKSQAIAKKGLLNDEEFQEIAIAFAGKKLVEK